MVVMMFWVGLMVGLMMLMHVFFADGAGAFLLMVLMLMFQVGWVYDAFC